MNLGLLILCFLVIGRLEADEEGSEDVAGVAEEGTLTLIGGKN